MSFISSLEQSKREAQAVKDPWLLRLEGLRGKKWDDGIERISTQTIFDVLEVPHRSRNAGACRRLAKLMGELGWNPIKARGLYARRVSRSGARICERHDPADRDVARPKTIGPSYTEVVLSAQPTTPLQAPSLKP